MTEFWSRIAKSDEPRPTRKLKNLSIEEVSLVDSGANQHAFVALIKRDTNPFEDEPGRHGTAPKDHDRFFNAGGSGPAHNALWVAFDNYRRSKGPAQSHAAFAAAWNDLDDDGKQAIRDEETAAEAARQAAAAAEQQTREKELSKMDSKLDGIKELAHDVVDGRIENHASKFQWYNALQKAAEEDRQPGESQAQSFARYSTVNVDGRAMWSAMKGAAGNDYVPAAPVEPVVKHNEANLEIRKLADELMAADPSLNRYDALVRVHNTRPDLSAAAKAA